MTVLIVSWNVRDYLLDCLASLADARVLEWASVVVIDNASDDGTQEMVQTQCPAVRFEQTGVNLGFSRANNRGIRQSASKYVMLLNPDTRVGPDVLDRLVEEMEADPTIGAIGPRQESADGKVHFDGAVNLPTVWNALCDFTLLSRLFPRSRWFSSRLMGWWDHRDDRDVPAIPGSAVLLRRSALDQVGLLDERMFCAEDMDLCRRLAGVGWRVRYLGTVAIIHHGGGSVKRSGRLALHRQIAYQSFWLYLRKHDGAAMAALMALSVGSVAALGSGVLGIVQALLKVTGRGSEGVSRGRTIFEAVLQWSLSDKMRFEHALGSAPTSDVAAAHTK